MKSRVVAAAVFVCLFVGPGLGTPDKEIRYETTELGSGKWQYTYEVINLSLSVPIEEFTIWFKYGDYADLSITTTALQGPSTNWSEVFWNPEPELLDDGAYDALTLDLVGIGVGENVSGFSVSFDWLGVGEPGSQYYEIIDPVTFETIEDGYTIPEPGTLLLLGLGGFVLRRITKVSRREQLARAVR